MLQDELFEIERCTWNAVLYSDGTMKRVNDSSIVICAKSKLRLSGYRKDRVLGPAKESPRVKQLLQQLENTKVSKEVLIQ